MRSPSVRRRASVSAGLAASVALLYFAAPAQSTCQCVQAAVSRTCYYKVEYDLCWKTQATWCTSTDVTESCVSTLTNPETCYASDCLGPTGPWFPTCGDGRCNGLETCQTCPTDCGLINNITCSTARFECNGYPRGTPVAALTFHGGPSAHTTSVLDSLERQGVKATFFLSGEAAAAMPEVVAQIVNEGHTIASRAYSNFNLGALTAPAIQDQMALGDIELSAFIPGNRRPRFMSPPFANITPEISSRLRAWGYEVVLWNLNSMDYLVENSTQARARYDDIAREINTHTARTSFIYAGSDLSDYGGEVAEKVIKYLLHLNYQIVSLAQCLDGNGTATDSYATRDLMPMPVEPLILQETEAYVYSSALRSGVPCSLPLILILLQWSL